jgi:Prolyl oligopeptidase family
VDQRRVPGLQLVEAAAGSGDHDLRRFLAYLAEKYQGYGPDVDYAPASTIEQTHRLERLLLLLHGELDDNYHPSNTMALVDALVRADRDFELVIIPGANHHCDTHPYYVRRVWDFLSASRSGYDRHRPGRRWSDRPEVDGGRRRTCRSADPHVTPARASAPRRTSAASWPLALTAADVARSPLPLAPCGLDEPVDLTLAAFEVGL